MKKYLKCIIAIMIIVLILMYNTVSLADNLTDLQKKQSTVNSQIVEAEDELEEIVSTKSQTLKQVSNLITQISSYQKEIDDLNDQITDLKKKIEDSEAQIKKDEEEYRKQKEAMNKRLAVMYRNRNTSYLEYLLSSSSLMDFLSSYYLISKMSDYDQNMLDQVNAHKEKIEKEKQELDKKKQEVENSQKTVTAKQEALQVVKKEKQNYADKLSEEEKEAEKKIQELQDANDDLDKKIKQAKAEIAAARAAAAKAAAEKAAAQKNNSNSNSGSNNGNSSTANVPKKSAATGNQSSYGFIWPTLTRYSVTTGWYYSTGRLHGASDISGAGIYGTPIYAMADGYVVVSEAKVNSSGNYVGYGNYVMIAHYNGLYTLYGHMSQRAVSTGQTVTQGQVIGYVGSTGNSTGPHVHIEVRTGNGTYNERVNPIYYLPSK